MQHGPGTYYGNDAAAESMIVPGHIEPECQNDAWGKGDVAAPHYMTVR